VAHVVLEPAATPPALVKWPNSGVPLNAAATTAIRRDAANTVTSEPITVSARS